MAESDEESTLAAAPVGLSADLPAKSPLIGTGIGALVVGDTYDYTSRSGTSVGRSEKDVS
jgi:hypothetical protein